MNNRRVSLVPGLMRRAALVASALCLLLGVTLTGALVAAPIPDRVPSPVNGVTGQQVSIAPSAQVSLEELASRDAGRTTSATPAQVVPFMAVPARGEIGIGVNWPAPPDNVSTLGFNNSTLIPPLKNNFQALPDNNTVIPPDTHGAVSRSYVMTMLNSQVRVQNRWGASLVTVSLASFWSPAGGSGLTDPRLLYDQGADRWIASCLSNTQSAASSVLFAITATGNPTGLWTYYHIDADPTNINWGDFDDIGFNQTWIAITSNMFTVDSSAFSGNAMWVIDKSTALAGGSITLTSFPVGSDLFGGYGGFALRVCQTFGAEPNLYIVDNSGWSSGGTPLLRLSQITGTASAPVWSAIPGSAIAGSGFFPVANVFSFNQVNASQLGTTTRISTNDAEMLNAVFRNGHVWCTHSGGLPASGVNRTAVFWYELNPTAMPSPIVQSGVVSGGSNVHYFFPSITVNANDDVLIGFTRSDATRYAEAVYTGRLGTDPASTMDPISVLKAGEASYIKDFGYGDVRWGDYSATMVDPIDDLSFWTIQEYAASDVGPAADDDRWGTRWGRISSGPVNYPPTAVCQNVAVNAAANCQATVTASAVNNGSSDPEDGTNLTLQVVPAGPYPLGTTAVELIVTDTQGAADTCNAQITVADHTRPTVTCPAPIVVNNATGQCGATVVFTPTATDNCPGVAVVSVPASGSVFPVGVTTVTTIATDGSGNADTCQFTVTVKDAEPPVVQCHADTVLIAPPGDPGATVVFSSAVNDNCPGAIVACLPPSGSFFPGGVTPVTCIATDAAGNKDTCGFNVTVHLCACPHQGDMNASGFIDVTDVLALVQIAFVNGADVHDPSCPRSRGDVNNDGVVDVSDVLYLIKTAFSNGPNPVNPCGP